MKYNLKNEWINLIIISLPILYLFTIWHHLPDTIPTHWNQDGVVDSYGSKHSILLIPFLLPILTYLLMTIVPMIPSQNKILEMGIKYRRMTTLMTLFMSALAIFIIYSTLQGDLNSNMMTFIIGSLFAVMGNYFPALKQNKYIGIKIPWTLESSENWKKTHQFAGKLWVIGGISIVIMSLIADSKIADTYFLITLFIIVIVPIAYSYNIKKSK